MSGKELKRLSSIYNSNILIGDELSFLRQDIKDGFKRLKNATEDLKIKDRPDSSAAAWKKVEPLSVEKQYPLVRSDVEQLIKKLDII